MLKNHYDVVILGRSIGALMAAALLARRDFTVLVLGQGQRAPVYHVDDFTFARRAFTLLSGTSPSWRRFLVELAQSQTWNRLAHSVEPMLQVIAPSRRFEVPPDLTLFGREIDREFPDLRRVVDDLYSELARVNAIADDAFEADAMWPPGSFWERRETARRSRTLPYVRAEPDADLLSEFPRGHFYRQIVAHSVLFATDLSTLPPPFAVARLHGAWTRGLLRLPGGEAELEAWLKERIAAHGGRCELGERVSELHLRRGIVSGVLIDGDEHPTGATFVLTEQEGEAVAALASGQGIHPRALKEWPRITSTVGRFVASAVVRKEGLPDPLGYEAIIVPRPAPGRRSLPIHVQRLEVDRHPDRALLIAEVLLPTHGRVELTAVRQLILDGLREAMPFLERHLLAMDSPHDGLGVWMFEQGVRKVVERDDIRGLDKEPEPSVPQLEVDPPGFLGLGGEPIRGPIERTLLLGRSVLPGLGQEGQLLAAWSAVRLVTKSDRRKARMRRDMWSKVEIG